MSGDEAVQRLHSLLEQTSSLRAEVEQLQIDQDGREVQESRVQLVMQKPASFSWIITEPYDDVTITDGTSIWHYEPDLEQVTIQPFEADPERTPAMLLNSDAESIAAAFEVSASPMADSLQRFILLPRRADRLFERLSLTFDGAVLQEMQLEDSLGQRTSLSFYEQRRNEPVSSDEFSFTPPAGVEVIDHRLP